MNCKSEFKKVNFNEFNYPVSILLNPLMFDSYLKYKYEYYLFFTFDFCFSKSTGNIFSVHLRDISKFFKETIRADDLIKSLDNINQYSDYLGFCVMYDKDNYSLVFKITDFNIIMEQYSKRPSIYLHKEDFINISRLNTYAIRLYLYLKYKPCAAFSLYEIKKLFGVQNSDYYNDFRRFNDKILKKSINLLNKSLPTTCMFKRNTKGNIEKIAVIRNER